MPSLLEALQRKYFSDYDRDDHPMAKTVIKVANNNNHNNYNRNNNNNNNTNIKINNSNSDNNNQNNNNNNENGNENENENAINNHEPRGTLTTKNDETITETKAETEAEAEAETEIKTVAETEAEAETQRDAEAASDAEIKRKASAEATADRLISIFVPRIPPLLCVPQLLVLNDCDIDCAGNFDSIRDKCRNVRELDLAQNKLNDWNEIFQIVQHMPQIEFLNLSRNHLSGTLCKTTAIMPLQNLRGIVLNGTYLDWNSIEILLKNLPILTELHLSLNNYNEIPIDLPNNEHHHHNDDDTLNCTEQVLPHKSLKILHFTSNPIEKWSEICRLGRIFPNLEKLVLAKCPLTSLSCDIICNDQCSNMEKNPIDSNCDGIAIRQDDSNCGGMDGAEMIFQNLQYLNLNCTSIDKWENVDYLAKYPKLNTLWLKNWPLWDQLECTEHERRQLLIARLPNVQILNGGGIITDDEREDAERSFIRYYMEKSEMDRPEQRFRDLIAKHGELEPLVNINLKPDKRIKIFLTYHDKTEARMVDIYRTVGDLKVKLERIVGLAANQMRLFYVDQDYKDFGPEEMRFQNKFLYSYNIQPGDEIIVDVKKKKKTSTSETD